MTGYFCEKCNQLSNRRQCPACGKNLPAASYRDVWNVVRLPVSDGIVWKSAVLILLAVTGILLLLSAGFCLLSHDMNSFMGQGTLIKILSVIPLGIVLILIVLAWQGRENVWYILENSGAAEQTWHRPSRIRCWSRFRAYRAEDVFTQPDGSRLMLSKEKTICWKDVCRVRFQADKGRILLYHTPHVAPLTLRIPAAEYSAAEALIKKVCKGKY